RPKGYDETEEEQREKSRAVAINGRFRAHSLLLGAKGRATLREPSRRRPGRATVRQASVSPHRPPPWARERDPFTPGARRMLQDGGGKLRFASHAPSPSSHASRLHPAARLPPRRLERCGRCHSATRRHP